MALAHLQQAEASLGCKFIGLGMWGDGVPVSWDRSESVQCFTWSLPGLADKKQSMFRVPFVVLPKHLCLDATLNFILELFGWCLQQMLMGTFPDRSHDGSALQDPCRVKLSGKSLGFRALLVDLKGDWEFFGNVLQLPRWDNKAGICFLCKATKEHLPSCDLSASWRQPDTRKPC